MRDAETVQTSLDCSMTKDRRVSITLEENCTFFHSCPFHVNATCF